ncbi:PilZ domain-containing protein [Cellvibrio polysaccharolyticus]|uniref:PilZ domain-containing protein n=1 Tax=Cellvibrio polysaccharolyticus TaxID=2082724 RepID=A0A928V317_9GAMM|nr:PilZ domain-containing protein [Cellvibrio polysaccharolyticus]MBE8716270.1 PilZ domain-containing protein [Cellvibrio polysaccharolyticus]
MAGQEQRGSVRTPFTCNIRITDAVLGEFTVKSRDISDTGVFVIAAPEDFPPVGSVVTAQVQGMMEDAPVLQMEVVRVASEGVGLRFMDV